MRFGLTMLLLLGSLVASAEPGAPLDLVKEAPKSAFTKATLAQPTVQPDVIVADNVRAVAILHAAFRYEKAGLFAAGDRLVADKRLVLPQNASLAPSERAIHLKFVSELVHDQFQAIVTASSDQMKAYGELVASVASSVDQFASDNVADSEERDSLETMARGMSNAGYGATHYAAAKLARQIRDILDVVRQPSVQKAYGAQDQWDLVAKLSGKSRNTALHEASVATAGTQLLLWLRHAGDPKLKARAKQDKVGEVAKKLKKLGVFGTLPPKAVVKLPKPKPLCLPPGATKPVPCATLAQKP
jgi:hypothetical protein